MKFDMTSLDGLQAACQEAQRRLDRRPQKVAEVAQFLQKVQDASTEDRETVKFMSILWVDNPLYHPSTVKKMNKSIAIYQPEFPHRFLELIDAALPENPQERAEELDDRIEKAKKLAWPDSPHGSTVTTVRTFAALFPHDFTTQNSPGRRPRSRNRNLYEVLGGAPGTRGEARINRWIVDRLESAIGQVDRSDWNAVARRMMLPEILYEISRKQRKAPDSEPDPTVAASYQAVSVDQPELSRIAQHFESLREEDALIFDRDMVESLHLGLWAPDRRHFAVLTGLSGTGKTQLAFEYAKAVTGKDGESNGRIRTIAVQPGWYDPTPLLGYVNPLGENRYTATEFLRFLIRANEDPATPHVCVLDEMNLSHPEQYLAPILSAMELEHGEIELHGGDSDEYGIPPSLRYPDNLVLIGTVNMDETTMGISDKVLDRAFTLEFWDVEVDRWPGWTSSPIHDQDKASVKEVLNRLTDALSPARLHFGWRVIEEVVRFMEQREEQSAKLSVNDALDRVIYAKVLPKLRGDDSPRFRKALGDCRIALNDLARSARKVEELIEDVDQIGSFRFWR